MFVVVLLAMVAAFLALRLYMVLGKRSGHEQTLAKPAEERLATAPAARAIPEIAAEQPPLADSVIDPAATSGVRALVTADPGFDAQRFLEGARSAYRMVLEAYWRGDEDELAHLCTDEVRHSFAEAIKARHDAGEVLDNRLVSIERAAITGAALSGKTASVTVSFEADIAAVTRDGAGSVLAGSLTDAVPTRDVWTFTRAVRDKDPNWILADTDEAA